MSTTLNDCGCCEGVTAVVPLPPENRPGLAQVSYRAGTHGDFLESALAALSDPQFAALRALTTRDPDDFTIALLDGWATVADVLTFYQERIANESWLGTATDRDSIRRLAQLIGYRLKPGVAAETPLSFALDETPGAPTQVAVAIGTKVQSVPGAGESPQTFETTEPLDARVEWNALTPALTAPPAIVSGATDLYLQGIATNLQPGDAILIVGDERTQNAATSPDKERWDLRVLLTVTPDVKNERTRVTWEKGLGKRSIAPASANVQIYAMRLRAALFGHNAPDPALVTAPGGGAVGKWPETTVSGDHFDLDSAYSRTVPGSWVALMNSAGYVELYRATTVSFPSRVGFALSGKVTRITPDTTENFSLFDLRDTLVLAQSERLETASSPLLTPADGSLATSLSRESNLLAPVEGSVIALSRLIPTLGAGRKIVVTGKTVRVRAATKTLTLVSADGAQSATVNFGASLVITALPTVLAAEQAKWSLRTDSGFEGTVTADRASLILTAARADDSAISELAVIASCLGNPSVLTLAAPLAHLYDRATVSIAANVAAATHGESVSEVLGSGDAVQLNQQFVLRQTPLTYVHSTAPGGAASSLQVRVNNLLWHEAPTLFGRGPGERIFTTSLADDGTITVRFGDGKRGARLPSGQQNIQAKYRRGIGLAGLVAAGQLSTLLTRPPGLKSAINPLAAEGADDPETLADARPNAPLTVLTLDRVVSLEDYEGFSAGYAGIAKAHAVWSWDGRTRGVFLTVASPRGAAVAPALVRELIQALHSAGDPFVPLRVEPFEDALFRLSARVAIDPDYDSAAVLGAANDALRAAYSFAQRSFGQPVILSAVIALIQATPGVIAVNVKALYRTGAVPKLNARLEASVSSDQAAELLTLDPAPIDLEVMP